MMKEKLKDWQKKLMTAKNEAEKIICQKQVDKYLLLLDGDSVPAALAPEKILPEIVKTYYTKFGEVIWYPNEKLIECQGAKFTELEILKLAGSGLAVSEFELELKKVFPFTELTDVSELTFNI